MDKCGRDPGAKQLRKRPLSWSTAGQVPERFPVSVVIPLYNKRDYVERALTSVLQQTAAPAEVIVVDDGSTDRGADVVRSFEGLPLRIVTQENAGASAARNRGVSEAREELVAFLDADDAWEPTFIANVLGLRARFPDAGAFATGYTFRSATGGVDRAPVLQGIPADPGWEGLVPDYFDSVSRGNLLITASSVCIPTKVLDSLGGFPDGLRRGEDQDTWARIALKHPVAFSRAVAAIYFIDPRSRASVELPPDDMLALVERLETELDAGSIPERQRPAVRHYLGQTLLFVASEYVRLGQRAEARALLRDPRARSRFMRWCWWWAWARAPSAWRSFGFRIRDRARRFLRTSRAKGDAAGS